VSEHGCPRCRSPLLPLDIAGLAMSSCPGCHGVFVTPHALDRLVHEKDARDATLGALPADEYKLDLTVQYLPCPTCGRLMNRKMYGRLSRVVVELCRDHGVFFERGGLATVLKFVAEGGLDRAKKRDEDDAAERARAAHADQVHASVARGLTEAGSLETAGTFGRFERERTVLDSLDVLFRVLGLVSWWHPLYGYPRRSWTPTVRGARALRLRTATRAVDPEAARLGTST
jgi:hypothetical protein